MQPLVLDTGGLRYTLEELPARTASRTVVAVALAPVGEGDGPAPAESDAARLLDRVDLYAFRSRQRFAQLVAERFGKDPSAVLGQLALLVDKIERERVQAEAPVAVELTPERKRSAASLLRKNGLLDKAAAAMDSLGLVGEEATKRLAYLVVTSRLLDRPLSALLFAPTSAGKSELLDVVTRLLPPEQTEYLSRLTPQALYYAGPNALRHKVLVVDEHVGAQEAEYSLRTLISRGSLTLRASPKPGGLARPLTVHGPISLLSGTTSSTVNEENLSRCLELTLDDSAAQTARVQAAQRAVWAGQGQAAVDLERWQDAQRLLESVEVVIPFAPRLRFPSRTSHDRRGNQKLLGLVAAHALLYQRQRDRDSEGRVVATPADYAVVHGLVRAAVGVDLGGLSPRAARAYTMLAEGQALTRREVSQRAGWAYNTAKKALAELVGQELARVTSAAVPARYALVDRSLLAADTSLLDPSELQSAPPSRRRRRRRAPSTEAA